MPTNKNNPGDGKKQSRLAKFHTKVISPIAWRSKAFISNRARPFIHVVVWVQTHPRVFVLCSFLLPTWWLKLIFLSVSSDDDDIVEVNFAPWLLLFLMALVFSLKKLNGKLYKSLLGDTVSPSEPCARVASGEDPGFGLSDGAGDSHKLTVIGSSGNGKKQSRMKAFINNRAQPFTHIVVWVHTHPRIFVLCALLIPTWWLKLISININSEFELEIRVFPWLLLFLIALVFSLKKLNSALYKTLIGDMINPSQPQAMAAYSDVPDIKVVDGVDEALKDIALDVANKLAALGFQLDALGYSEIAGTGGKFVTHFNLPRTILTFLPKTL